MCTRYLGCLLLIWFPGLLHAQQTCQYPKLANGYFDNEQETYSDGESLTYACDKGYKPVEEGWWATTICKQGTWSPEPLCIDEKACFPPDIPNANSSQELQPWYEEKFIFRLSCQEGYQHENNRATTQCLNGEWSLQLVCKNDDTACVMPPKIRHAVIIDQGYQDVFAADSELQYECEDGYVVEEAETSKKIVCLSGMWSKGPVCIEASRANVGRDESTVGGAGGGHTASAGSGRQPTGGDRGSSAGTTQSGTEGRGTGGGHTASAGRGTQPTGGGSSTTSDRNSGPFISIKYCGAAPAVQNGDVVERADKYLKYKCAIYYKLVGSDTVVCHSDRTWSPSPTCEESYCRIDPAQLAGSYIKVPASGFIEEGKKFVHCTWPHNYYSWFECTNRRLSFTQCCDEYYIRQGTCPWIQRSG